MTTRRQVTSIKKIPYGRGKGTISILHLACEHQIMRTNGSKRIGDLQTCFICTDPDSSDAIQQKIFLP